MPLVSPDLLGRFDVTGPRYTSYPTADRFVEACAAGNYKQALAQRHDQAALALPLSLYIHIPFCRSLCYYCACNKIVTKHQAQAQRYLDYLSREIDLHVMHMGHGQEITQLHLGGGSPTFLSDQELQALMQRLRQSFSFSPHAELAIEVDPRTVTPQRLAVLAGLGFNRLSFGVQDVDPAVQAAIHRVQSTDKVVALLEAARTLGFASINVDLIYGLPRQTPASFAQTLAQMTHLRPDRIALYSYAHLPERFKAQRRISSAELPSPSAKTGMLHSALTQFEAAGYDYIGMDHFALPQDDLAVAKRQGRLHRNFQGYSTQADCDLIALGVSAIGKVGATYSQNTKSLQEYYDYLDQGQLPIVRGLALSRDDLVRRAIIMALMCQGRLQWEAIESTYLLDFQHYFALELQALQHLAQQGLVRLEDEGIEVTAQGWFFVRAVAMVFDRYLQADQSRARFSKII